MPMTTVGGAIESAAVVFGDSVSDDATAIVGVLGTPSSLSPLNSRQPEKAPIAIASKPAKRATVPPDFFLCGGTYRSGAVAGCGCGATDWVAVGVAAPVVWR